MAYLEWSRAHTARVNKAHVDALMLRAGELSQRLQRQLDANELPFLSMGYVPTLEKELPPLVAKARQYRNMLVLGIGGSALGARAMQQAFAPSQDLPGRGGHEGKALWIADNVCPETMSALLSKLKPEQTIVVTISKSGGTIETISQYFLVRQWLQDALGQAWSEHMIVVTDAAKGFLRAEATQFGLGSLEVPDNLGGRYSALSAVGLLPAAFLGIDWQALLQGADSVAKSLRENPSSLATHPSFKLACWAKALEDYGYNQLIFFCYEPLFATYGPWFAQLWAESLGKEGLGTQPIPATGVTDQHSVNQMFLDGIRNKACLFVSSLSHADGPTFPQDLPSGWEFLAGKSFGSLLDAEAMGTQMALVQHGVPLVRVCLDNASEFSGGALMMLLEAATVFTGWLMGINPLDQPAVELGKRLANAKLGKPGYDTEQAALAAYLALPEEKQAF